MSWHDSNIEEIGPQSPLRVTLREGKYTDPSGEIVWVPIVVGAVVGAYIGGSVASGTMNPFTSQYWNEGWEGVIAGGVIGATIGASVGIAIGAKGAALSAGQKAIIAGTYSGTLNMVNHYDADEGFGFSSLAYFGAGFAGGAAGSAMGPVAGIAFGGTTNVVAGIGTGNVTDAYSMGQHFVGGALAGYAGHSITAAKPIKADYLNKVAHKKFFQYGVQALAADFAYTSKDSYTKKGLEHHFGTFFMGGTGGLLQAHAMNNPLVRGGELGQAKGVFAKRAGLSLLGYGIEYVGTSHTKANYQGMYTKGWETKAGLSTFKSLMYSLMLR